MTHLAGCFNGTDQPALNHEHAAKKALSFLLSAPHIAPLPEAIGAKKYPRLLSEGLPPIEEDKIDYTPEETESYERELGTRELFVKYILTNKFIWMFALANLLVYITRYSMLDWGQLT